MHPVVLHAHFDGEQIRLDEPFELRPDTKLLVTILSEPGEESLAWYSLSEQGLGVAYGDEEPDYPPSAIKVPNLKYEGG